MSPQDRMQFKADIHELCEQYGPWSVLFYFTEAIKPEFQKLQATESKKRNVQHALDIAVDLEKT
jgi:hypothetical protein